MDGEIKATPLSSVGALGGKIVYQNGNVYVKWYDGCAVTVTFDGKVQVRSGMKAHAAASTLRRYSFGFNQYVDKNVVWKKKKKKMKSLKKIKKVESI